MRKILGSHRVSTTMSNRRIFWPMIVLVGVLAAGTLTGCNASSTNTIDSSTSTTTGITVTASPSVDTAGPLAAAKVLAGAIEDKDNVAYASVWDNDAVVGSLYEPFIAEILNNTSGFQRLAVQQGRGDDPEGLLREAMPKEKFITITNFNAGEWAKQRLDLTNAVVTSDGVNAKVTAKTGAGLDIVLVMEKESGDWKVIAIEGPFRDFFVKNMGIGFDSVMPKN